MINISSITLPMLLQWASYWITFWTVVNFVLPPREIFADFPDFLRFYNVLLKLVAFWGALNIRQFTVRLYSAVTNAPTDSIATVETKTTVKPADHTQPETSTVTTTPITAPVDKEKQ